MVLLFKLSLGWWHYQSCKELVQSVWKYGIMAGHWGATLVVCYGFNIFPHATGFATLKVALLLSALCFFNDFLQFSLDITVSSIVSSILCTELWTSISVKPWQTSPSMLLKRSCSHTVDSSLRIWTVLIAGHVLQMRGQYNRIISSKDRPRCGDGAAL